MPGRNGLTGNANLLHFLILLQIKILLLSIPSSYNVYLLRMVHDGLAETTVYF